MILKEYQPVSEKKYVLPHAVYHQCIWIVRDMERMERLLADGGAGAAEAVARARLSGISDALSVIPAEYRNGVIAGIVTRGGLYDGYAHENTWKRWKQRFIFNLARNLGLY